MRDPRRRFLDINPRFFHLSNDEIEQLIADYRLLSKHEIVQKYRLERMTKHISIIALLPDKILETPCVSCGEPLIEHPLHKDFIEASLIHCRSCLERPSEDGGSTPCECSSCHTRRHQRGWAVRWKKWEHLVKHYELRITFDPALGWHAITSPELKGFKIYEYNDDGEDIASARYAIVEWLERAEKAGRPIPQPRCFKKVA